MVTVPDGGPLKVAVAVAELGGPVGVQLAPVLQNVPDPPIQVYWAATGGARASKSATAKVIGA
jgi:hypothetical protein